MSAAYVARFRTWWQSRDTRPERTTCWICEKPIKPDKAPRALCCPCACSGGLGPYT